MHFARLSFCFETLILLSALFWLDVTFSGIFTRSIMSRWYLGCFPATSWLLTPLTTPLPSLPSLVWTSPDFPSVRKSAQRALLVGWIWAFNQTMTVKPANSWDEHLETLVSIQHLCWIRNAFHSEIDKTTSSKQTRSFLVRKEIKTTQCRNFPNPIFIRVAELISRINILFSIILNSLLQIVPHIFYEPYSSRSACYAGLCSFLWIIWSRSVNNIHLGHLLRSVSCRPNNKSFLKRSIWLFRFKFIQIETRRK